METKDVPVLLITGYLGSGKTTLLNRILKNEDGLKFAVIVNDIGEINIDADLIGHDGIVNKADDSLVSLQNGCICCTLQNDLIDQLFELLKMQRFDYIVIEASGVCDPEPIAQTICTFPQLGENYNKYGHLRLDSITTVVDALRMKDEFNCADDLNPENIGEEDIENLLIQQIEFCNLILLNKASEVSPEELERIRKIIRALQPKARIIECDYADVPMQELVDTGDFGFNHVATSAGWIQELSRFNEAPHEHEHDHEHCHCHEEGHEHCHCHHHHHHNEEGETEEYGIGTFVYYTRRPFDLNKFDFFVTKAWPKNIIRAKGLCYFKQEYDEAYIFEQAGSQKHLSQFGRWYATLPENELEDLLDRDPVIAKDWDEKYGDRMQKIVFIGQKLDKKELTEMVDFCLADED